MKTQWLMEVAGWFSLPALVVLGVVFVFKKQHREFPVFFSYITAGVVTSGGELIAYAHGYKTYFYVYWTAEAVNAVFAFFAIHELFVQRLFPGFYRVTFYRYLFPVVALLIGTLAVFSATRSHETIGTVTVAALCLSLLQGAIIGFMVLLMSFMGRRWTKQEFGVSLGLGLYAAASLLTTAIRTRAHYHSTSVDQLPVLAYDVACLIWIVVFATASRRATAPVAERIAPEILEEAHKAQQLLKDFLTPGKRRDSDREKSREIQVKK